jgi:6-pyruvoyltetrahydropterin/6-carboxytetrahydropterin synthase
MPISVTRKAHFNSAHRLHNPEWSAQKNEEVFGLCNLPNYHGHNYDLEVTLTGEINPDTGFVVDLKKLKHLIKSEIEDRFDHKNLNLDTVEFANLNPTAENIAIVIWNILRSKINPEHALKITLYETERNFVTYSG